MSFNNEANLLKPEQKTTSRESDTELEKPLSRQELVAKEYEPVINLREERYDKDTEQNQDRKLMRSAIETHNNTVLEYANKLIEINKNLTPAQKVAATLATILHDSGKLNSPLLEHHLKGVEYAEEIIGQIIGQKFEGVEITEELKEKAKEAIERHMNHPFLVRLNKNKRFPEPEDEVDKIVFDADMIANVGFKNVGFRIIDKNFKEEDLEVAEEKNIPYLQATFENVMQDVRKLKNVVLSKQGRELTGKLIKVADKIFHKIDFKEIQNELKEIKDPQIIKKRLNEEIEKISNQICRIEDIDVKNFLI